jgi:hypothetical protein
MGVESATDRLAFLDLDDFAVEATYTPVSGAPVTILGILDTPQASRSVSAMVDVTIPAVSFVCRTDDVGDDAEGGDLTVAGDDYVIRAVITDGTGMSTLTLELI